jgi:hypothetical protein
LSSSQSGDHPKNNLAKIWLHTSYESREKNHSWLLIPIRKSDELGTFFPLYRLKSYFEGQFFLPITEMLPKKDKFDKSFTVSG